MTSRAIHLYVWVHVCCSTVRSLITSQIYHLFFANVSAKDHRYLQCMTLKEQFMLLDLKSLCCNIIHIPIHIDLICTYLVMTRSLSPLEVYYVV